MVRDGVANIVFRLQELGVEPRKVGADLWDSRCPAHRSAEWALFNPVATVLIALARQGVQWSGKPQDLDESIVKVTGPTLGPRWPKTISQFGGKLRRIAPQLRLHGIHTNFGRKGHDRVVPLKTERAGTRMPSTN